MRILSGKRIRIIAIPQKLFGKPGVQDWSAVLQMSGSIGLSYASDTRIIIEECSTEELLELRPKLDPLADPSKCIAFNVTLNRSVVASYLRHARAVVRSEFQAVPAHNDRKAREVVFAGELFRDFERKVFMLLIAAHLADPRAVSLSRIISQHLDGGNTSQTFGIPFVMDERADELKLQRHSAREIYAFIENRPGDSMGAPQSQFMKGLSYLSQTFRNTYAATMINFVWALAATEAMLSTPSDKANSGMLELRLKALLGPASSDKIVGTFREIYRYRNALLHGNVALPFSFDDRNMFGYDGIKYSNTMPFDFSLFTYGLAIKILQRFFEIGRYDIRYNLEVAAN